MSLRALFFGKTKAQYEKKVSASKGSAFVPRASVATTGSKAKLAPVPKDSVLMRPEVELKAKSASVPRASVKQPVALSTYEFWKNKPNKRLVNLTMPPRGPIETADLAKKLYDFDLLANPGLPQWNGGNVELVGISTTDRRDLSLEYWKFSAELYEEAGRLYALLHNEHDENTRIYKDLSIQEYNHSGLIKLRIAQEEAEKQKLLKTRFVMKLPQYAAAGQIEITCKRVHNAEDCLRLAQSLFEQEKFKDAEISLVCNEVDSYTYRLICLHAAHALACQAATTLPAAVLYAEAIKNYINVMLTDLSIPLPEYDLKASEARQAMVEKTCEKLGIAAEENIPKKIQQKIDYLVKTKTTEERLMERIVILEEFIKAVAKVPGLFKRTDILEEVNGEIRNIEQHLKSDHVDQVEQAFLDLISKELLLREKALKVQPKLDMRSPLVSSILQVVGAQVQMQVASAVCDSEVEERSKSSFSA